MDSLTLVRALDEYTRLIEEAKERLGKLRTNCPLFLDAIKRYIDLGRLYYEPVKSGLVFYTDEDNYYQGYFYVVPDRTFVVEKKGKPVVIQNIYQGTKKDWLLSVESALSDNGFVLRNTMKHGVFTGYDNIPKIKKTGLQIHRIFEKEGLSLSPVSMDRIPEMLAFQTTIKEIPFYEFPYYTLQEYAVEAEEGRLLMVTDRQGKMIAARHLIVNGKKAYGWVGIQEEYKSAYGIAIAFLLHALDYIQEHDIKMCSWVDETNIPSLQYHERLGTDWTGHKQSIWVMDALC